MTQCTDWRNYGNEGWCSHNDHPLDLQLIILSLPAPAGATSLEVVSADKDDVNENHLRDQAPGKNDEMTEFKTNVEFRENVTPVKVSEPKLEGDVAKIAFAFPPHETQARVNGILHIRWRGVQVSPRVPAGSQPDCGGKAVIKRDGEQFCDSGNEDNCSRRSNQAGDWYQVKVVSFDEIATAPLSIRSREEMVATGENSDQNNKKNASKQNSLLKEHCKKGQQCRETE